MDYRGSFVCEVSGDSEADFDPFAAVRHEVSSLVEDNDDDAQSCICDSGDVSDINGSVVVDDDEQDDDGNESEGCCDDGWDDRYPMGFCETTVVTPETVEEEDEEDGVVNEEKPKRNILINEMEDRLFWETCLATGY